MECILKKGEVMSLTAAAHHLIRVNEGYVWLTGSEDPRDYVLNRGGSFDTNGKGTLVMEALTDSAFCLGYLHAVPASTAAPMVFLAPPSLRTRQSIIKIWVAERLQKAVIDQ